MRCIFCKEESSSTKSIEHVVPESLGNILYTLPKGSVCDSCNNYFGRKIENPILSSGMFKLLRFERNIANKRRKIPLFKVNDIPELPDFRLFTRFIGKIGLEVLAAKTALVENWNEEIINTEELDLLRSYVRYNKGETWPMYYRTLYPVNSVFQEDRSYFEILHEYDLLYTNREELYIVVVILGVEFVLNLGLPSIDGFMQWLVENDYQSHLYTGKNK